MARAAARAGPRVIASEVFFGVSVIKKSVEAKRKTPLLSGSGAFSCLPDVRSFFGRRLRHSRYGAGNKKYEYEKEEAEFEHPHNAVYILGSEDAGLPPSILSACHEVVSIPSERYSSYNVASAGSIVLYDRLAKKERRKEKE